MTQDDHSYSPAPANCAGRAVSPGLSVAQPSAADTRSSFLAARDRVTALIENAWQTKVSIVGGFGCATAALDS